MLSKHVPLSLNEQKKSDAEEKEKIDTLRIVKDGVPYILVPALIAIVLFAVGYWPVALVFVLLTAFMAFFFRDPRRVPPADPSLVVSPADGKVTLVADLTPGEPNSAKVVSIFLSPFDVHINRAPIGGKITDVSYARGKFLMATDKKASLLNEQNVLTIEGQQVTVVCKQIAGILARRIVCWKRKGDRVDLGERFGLIKFSSRTDLVVPSNVELLVAEGNRVKGGTSIIGRIR